MLSVYHGRSHVFYLIACCTLSLLLSGCSFRKWGNMGYSEPYNFTSDKILKRDYKTKAFREEYDRARKAGEEEIAKQERNEIIGELLLVIDTAHGRFERNLRGNKTAFDLTTDFAQLGLTGAAAVSGGAATKSILAAIATGVKGAELSVNKRAFQEQAIEALLATMRAAQAERKVEIIRSMKLSTEDYNLEIALGDVTQYFYDGTLTRSFERLAAEAKQRQKDAEAEVLKAKRGEEE